MNLDLRIDAVATGFRYPEGPALDGDGNVWVVELGNGRVSRVDPAGRRTTVATLPGSPNGAAVGPGGTLYVCNNGGRHPAAPSTGGRAGEHAGTESIQTVTPTGVVSTVLAAIDGVPLNAPNDICFDGRHGLWFSDPSWDMNDDGTSAPGSVCYLGLDGTPRRVHTGLQFPNGLALTASGRLVVDESSTGALWSFPVHGPGELGEPTLLADCGPGAVPDGLALDSEGRVLLAGHGDNRIHVVAPDGTPEGSIDLGHGHGPTNLCFGGPDHRDLFVTAANTGALLTLRWPVPGAVLPTG